MHVVNVFISTLHLLPYTAVQACMRSVVGTLAPLFLRKMIQRAFLQPVITLLLWKLSVKEDGQLLLTPLGFLGAQVRTSGGSESHAFKG